MTFISEVYMLRLRALDYIRKTITGGNPYELIDEDSVDEKDSEFYCLPQALSSYESYGGTRHDFFSIISVTKTDEKLTFNGYDTYGEADESEKTFDEDEVYTEVLCGIADKIAELEDGKLISGELVGN